MRCKGTLFISIHQILERLFSTFFKLFFAPYTTFSRSRCLSTYSTNTVFAAKIVKNPKFAIYGQKRNTRMIISANISSYYFISRKFQQQLLGTDIAELYRSFGIVAATLDIDNFANSETVMFYKYAHA